MTEAAQSHSRSYYFIPKDMNSKWNSVNPPRTAATPLRQIRSGTAPTVVAVDFRGGRPAADFLDLLDSDASPHALYELVPPGLDGVEAVASTPSAYAAFYANALTPLTDGPVALVGYCSGALIALAVAGELIRRRRPAPSVLAYDAEPILFDDAVAAYTQATGASAEVAVSDAARQRFVGGEPEVAAELLVEALRRDLGAQLDDAGLRGGDPTRDALLDRQAAWMRYLVAAAGVDNTLSFPRPTHLFASEGRTEVIAADRHEVFAIGTDDLLASGPVQQATLAALATIG